MGSLHAFKNTPDLSCLYCNYCRSEAEGFCNTTSMCHLDGWHKVSYCSNPCLEAEEGPQSLTKQEESRNRLLRTTTVTARQFVPLIMRHDAQELEHSVVSFDHQSSHALFPGVL